MAAVDVESRSKLVEEHVLAEVDHDLESILRTWGASPPTPSDGAHHGCSRGGLLLSLAVSVLLTILMNPAALDAL